MAGDDDEISRVGGGRQHEPTAREMTLPGEALAQPGPHTSPSVDNFERDEVLEEVEKGPNLPQVTVAEAPELEELPWMSLVKWRKSLVMAGLFLGLFLSTLDTSIIATALVTIVSDFGDFERSPWVVVAYLLLYMSLAVAFARLSDVYGRKTMVLAAWIIFTAFSIGCGAAQSMTQLIVFRAFQGIGGSGMFSMTMVMIPEVVSPEKMGLTSALIGMTLGCSGVLGPILGGVISHFTTWRVIFYINIPIGCAAIASILVAWPRTPGLPLSSWAAFQSIDFFGILLVLTASVLHIWGFQSVSSMEYDWNSPVIIALLVLAASCWVTFVIWQLFLERRKKSLIKPLFPFHIVKHRVMASAILSSFLTGFPFYVTVVTLPERFQIVNGASSLMAGVYLLPVLGASAVGSYLGGAISGKRNLTSYTLIASALLQTAGCGLMSTIGDAVNIMPRQYAFEVILGLGIGLSLSTVTIMTTVQAKHGDLAAAQGAVAQVRVLGGIIGLTIATTLFNRRSNSAVTLFLTPAEVDALHTSPLAILSFSTNKQLVVKLIYAMLFSLQMRVLMYICAVAVAVTLLSWQKNPPDVRKRMEVHRRSGPPVAAITEISR